MVSITNSDHTIAGQNPVKLKSKLRLLRQTNAPFVSQRLDVRHVSPPSSMIVNDNRWMRLTLIFGR
jgi:hypothetical protein